MRLMTAALLAATTLAALPAATSATAKDFEIVVAFGDSLSDTGNLSAALGGAVPGPLYFDGRFSNGPVWVELLAPEVANIVNPDTLTAFGGAESGTGGTVGVTTQIGGFLAASGGVPDGALVTLMVGGNDILNNALTTPPEVLVGNYITNMTTSITTLAAGGGETFLVSSLPDVGRSPGAAAAGIATEATALANAMTGGLSPVLTGLEDSLGVRIVQMDLLGLFDDMFADPAAYGLVNLTVPCVVDNVETGACATADAADAALFWDAIHPTATAHQILAQFAAGTLVSDLHGARYAAMASILGPQIVENVYQGASSRLDTLRGLELKGDDIHTGVYATYRMGSGDRPDAAGLASMDYDLSLITIGADYKASEMWTFGGAVSFGSAEAEASDGYGEIEADTFAATLYASFRMDGLYADVIAAAAWNDYESERATLFDPRPLALGEADGRDIAIGTELGYMFDVQGVDIGPVVALRYLDTEIDAFTETGAAMLGLSFAEVSDSALVGAVGIRAAGRMTLSNGTHIIPRAKVTYQTYLNGMDVTASSTSNIGIVRTVYDEDKGSWVGLEGGVTVTHGMNLEVSLDYAGGISRYSGTDNTFMGRFLYRF